MTFGQVELLFEFQAPLLPQAGRADDEELSLSFGPVLAENQTGLDGLAKSDFIGKDTLSTTDFAKRKAPRRSGAGSGPRRHRTKPSTNDPRHPAVPAGSTHVRSIWRDTGVVMRTGDSTSAIIRPKNLSTSWQRN
jgi:hypothetical protein